MSPVHFTGTWRSREDGDHGHTARNRCFEYPTHVILSIATLTRTSEQDSRDPRYLFPAAIGALVPDAAMFVFYAVVELVLGNSEREIWTTCYFLPAWHEYWRKVELLGLVA